MEPETTLDQNPAPELQEQPPAPQGDQAPIAVVEPQVAAAAAPRVEPVQAEAEAEDEGRYDDAEAEEIPRVLAMGVMDVDKKLGGGLPLDSITLVEGDPESGKSVVIEQLAYNALHDGLSVAAFLSETQPRKLLDQMLSLGMPSMDYYLLRRLSLYPVTLRVEQDRAERIMHKLLRYLENSPGVDVVIFDSVTPLLFQFDARYVLSFLATCKELANLGKTIIVTLHSYAINESLRLRADSIVDAHLRLRIEELGKQVVRTLEVSKIRGAVKTINNSVSFTVEPGIGLKTVPISKTKA